MLKLLVPNGDQNFNEATSQFEIVGDELELEHSLFSLSKWESKFKKPFFSEEPKTSEETLWYIEAMTLTPNVSPEVFHRLVKTESCVDKINEYISAELTATWFAESTKEVRQREVITAEIMYYWMVALSIPFECQYWHLSRLITLVRVCNEKNKPPEKPNRAKAAEDRKAMMAKRRAEAGIRS